MYKSLNILLISILIFGMVCFEVKKNSSLREEKAENLKVLQEENSYQSEQSQIMKNNPNKEWNFNANYNPKPSFKTDFKLKTLKNLKKLPIILNKIRLLSNDHFSEDDSENDNDADNEVNESNRTNSSCSSQKCRTCVNSTCTQCKLDSNGQQKYLLVNGICYSRDNQTSNNYNVDEHHKWEDYEDYNEEGQVSYGGRKYKCQVGCKTCDTTTDFTKCSTCIDGFALNSTTQKCMKCEEKCVTCSSNNLFNCTSCYPGWTINEPDVNGTYTCAECSTDHCGECQTVDVCTKCKDFYYLSQSGVCQSCLQNCRICNDSSFCQQCFSGYFMAQLSSGTQSCILCASGCAACSNLTNCLSCYPGYFMNSSTQSCEKCSQNCWSCNSSVICLRCVMGTQLVNSSCVQIIDNCAVMNQNNTCNQCYEGYQLSDSGNQCQEKSESSNTYNKTYTCGQNQYVQNHTCMNCTISVDNCQRCNDTSCLKCISQYFLTNNGLSCTLCSSVITGCQKCKNSIFCSKCADGYYMEQDKNGSAIVSYGNCIKCDNNCQTCNQNTIYCTSCNNGYMLTTARTCVPPNQFNFTLMLNLDLNQFPSKISQFKSDLGKLISDSNVSSSEKQNFVQITKIASGSVIVQGTMSASSSSALQNTLTNFNTALSVGSSFSGIEVLSSKAEKNNSSSNSSTSSSSSQSSSSKTGVIVGVVIGVVSAIIIIVVILVYCCCCKKTTEQAQEINLDEKRSTSTVDNFAALNPHQNSQGNNIHPQPGRPEYFL